MVDRFITWYHTLTWEKVLLAVAQWLTASSFIVFLTFSTDILYSFSFLRNIILRLITVVLVFLYILIFSLNRSYRPRFDRCLSILALLFFWQCLSALINGTELTSFWGDYLRMDGLYTMGTYVAFTFVVSSSVKPAVFRAQTRISGLILGMTSLFQNTNFLKVM
jgi:hypothetical protein